MPIYEYKCTQCGHIEERIVPRTFKVSFCLCTHCRQVSVKIMSAPHFRITGFNAKNGYNLPNYSDVIDADGRAKDEWGRK